MSIVETPNNFKMDNSGKRIVIDPVTRIEGHMRCEVNVDKNNIIQNAVSTGTVWRGLEVILRGRDPRDAWAFIERICGVCTGCHALASVRAVEDALDIIIPKNAYLIREIMAKTLQIHDHVVHFYHLHALDWVNPVNALKADPKATSGLQKIISPNHPKSSPGYFKDIQMRIRKFVESGQLGIFKNGYWDNPAYRLSPEADLMAVTHYLEALDWQKEIVKIHTVFGGRNPHPNYMVGGVPCAINMEDNQSAGAPINMERLNFVKARIEEARTFNTNVYVPDVIAIAAYYRDWTYGGGISVTDLMDYGSYQTYEEYALGKGTKETAKLPGGVILGGDWSKIHPIDVKDPEQVQEFVTHSWYDYPEGMENKGLHPWDGITEPNYVLGDKTVGTSTNIKEIDESAKYSWIKSPRWRGHAVEVGPLPRYILGYVQGVEYIVKQVDSSLARFNEVCKILDPEHKDVTDLKVFLGSTIGRTLTRALESEYCGDLMLEDFNMLVENIKSGDTNTANVEKWDPENWPAEARGVGVVGAPRGANAHWIVIKNGKIANYQCIVPTTWNGSPRDADGNIGAYEASLMNTYMERPEEPVEVLRTLHSFDPCLACSTHVMSEDGEEMASVTVR